MANWSAIGALGEAAKASGDYFGVLAVEKTRTQRLAEARAEQLEDAATARSQKLEDIDARQKYDKTVYEGKREDTTEDAVAGELRRDAIAAKAADRTNNAEIEEWNRQRGITSSEWSHSSGNTLVKGDTRLEMFTNKNGDVIYQKATRNAEGTVVPASSGEVDSSLAVDSVDAPQQDSQSLAGFVEPGDVEDGPTREFEAKAQYQAQGAAIGLGDMLTQMENGYKPGDPSALLDQWLTGTDVGNLVVSDQAQAYQRGATQLYENLLRRATGAAAPDTEVTRYFKMFVPRAGDGPMTIASKLEAAGRMIEAMDTLGSPDLGPDSKGEDKEWDRQWRNRAYQITKGILPQSEDDPPAFTQAPPSSVPLASAGTNFSDDEVGDFLDNL
jgi:hypothetical protein